MIEDSKKEIQIAAQLNSFLEILESIEDTLPSIKKNLFLEFQSKKENLDRFLEENATNITRDDTGKIVNFDLPWEKARKAIKLRRELSKSTRIMVVIPINFLVSIISEYDAYLGELMKEFYIHKPEMLNSLEKNLTFNEIIGFQSIDKIKEFVIEKDIETTLRKSHIEQLMTLEKKFSVSLTQGLEILPEFIEITERRNLFVHCKGVVSSQYLKVCTDSKVSLDGIVLGKRLYANNKYLLRAIDVIAELVVKMTHVLWSKIFKEHQEKIDFNIIKISYDLLNRKKYKLVIDVLTLFTSKSAKHESEESKRYMIINMAIALKSLNEEKKCKELLGKYDWSAVSNLFKMAEKILTDDFENAVILMRKAYISEELSKENMIEWPLFNNFRDTEEFKKIYAELFPTIEVKPQVETAQIAEVDQAVAEAAQMEAEVEADARAEAEQMEAEARAEAAQMAAEDEAEARDEAAQMAAEDDAEARAEAAQMAAKDESRS